MQIRDTDLAALWRKLAPYAAGMIAGSGGAQPASGGGAEVVRHALSDTQWHSGQLAQSQAPWAVTQSQFSAHAADPDAHHARLHSIISSSDHSATGSQYSVVGLTATNTLGILSSTADGAANHNTLLRSGANGDLQVDRLVGVEWVRSPLIDSNAGQLMELRPGSHLALNPVSKIVRTLADVAVQSDNYASQTTGWRIGYDGAADFRYLFTDELHAKVFIADLEQALAGGQIISKSVAVVAASPTGASFVIPAAGAAAFLYVEDLPSAPNMACFQSGDIVRLRIFSRAGGGLNIADCWGIVTSYVDMGGADEGKQRWTFTRSAAPNAGAATAGNTIEPGAIALDYGTSGNGFYEVNAIDGLYAANSPYAQIVSWSGHPATGQTVRGRFGNLRGIFNIANEYGLAAGGGFGVNDSYLRLSNVAAELHNLPINMYRSGTQTGYWSSDGSSFWIGPNSGDKRIDYSGDTLTVRGAVAIQPGSSGYANLGGIPTGLFDINADEAATLRVAKRAFAEFFETSAAVDQWQTLGNVPELSLATLAGTAGGKVLMVGNNDGNDQGWLVHKGLIPFDPTKVYKVSIRVRLQSGLMTGTLFAGVAGVAADGATFVDKAGANSASITQHMAAAANQTLTSTLTTYTGYIWGHSTDPLAAQGTGAISDPMKLHQNVAYLRPVVIANYSGATGRTYIDFVTIEILDAQYTVVGPGRVRLQDTPADAGLYLTPSYQGYWTGAEWKTYMDAAGNFRFAGSASNNYIQWTAAANKLAGVGGGVEQWYADATDGKLKAGAGAVELGVAGIRLAGTQDNIYRGPQAITFGPGTSGYGNIRAGWASGVALAGAPTFYSHLTVESNGRLWLAARTTNGDGIVDVEAPGGLFLYAGATVALNINGGGTVALDNSAVTARDADTAYQFGRALLGYVGISDYAALAHRDQATSGGAGWRQTSLGDVVHNVPTGRTMFWRVNNATVMQMTAGRFDSTVPLGLVTVSSTPAAVTNTLVVWFDGTNLKARVPGGTTRTINWT